MGSPAAVTDIGLYKVVPSPARRFAGASTVVPRGAALPMVLPPERPRREPTVTTTTTIAVAVMTATAIGSAQGSTRTEESTAPARRQSGPLPSGGDAPTSANTC